MVAEPVPEAEMPSLVAYTATGPVLLALEQAARVIAAQRSRVRGLRLSGQPVPVIPRYPSDTFESNPYPEREEHAHG